LLFIQKHFGRAESVKLPNAHLASVAPEKITDDLLNAEHPYGASKARFFGEFDFEVDAWQKLATALREHGQKYEVAKTKKTPFGPRYEVDGPLLTPDGRTPRVRTVWQVDEGEIAPRLITAYPLDA
jgi:hypothetical protein